MKIIITGALGHIGSYLIRNLKLRRKIHTLYLIDNLSSERYCSLYDLKKNYYQFVDQDLSKEKIKIKNVDLIIHLAAKTNAAQSSKYEKEFYDNNFKATKNIVKYCTNTKTKLIFASTTSVYGPQTKYVDEDCNDQELNPQSPYADVKLLEEKYIIKKFKNIKNSYLILRFGTVFGFSSGMRFHTAVNKFCFQACAKKPLTVWRTAFNQNRPYLSLSDLSKSISHIINKKLIDNNTYNIVSKNMSVKELINIISKYTRLDIKYVDHEIMNQLSYNVINEKFKSTGFNFDENVSNSIKEIISKLSKISK